MQPVSPISLGVARNSNRLNSQNAAPASPLSRGSRTITNVLPAGKTLQAPCYGSTFYVINSSGAINIKPQSGMWQTFYSGTGLGIPLENTFSLLEIQNPNSYAIAFEIFIGFDTYIDNRLVLVSSQNPIVAYPTYPVTNAANEIVIADLSGQEFTDANGNQWYALNRVAIVASNLSSGDVYIMENAAKDKNVLALQPLQSFTIPLRGDYNINTGGGGNIDAIVHEEYEAIAKNPVITPG